MLDNYITKNYHYLRTACNKYYHGSDFEDIFHECFIYMMEKPTKKVNELIIKNDFNKYFIQMFRLNCHSATSPYQFKYNKLQYTYLYTEILGIVETEVTNEYLDLDLNLIIESLDIHFINKLIFIEYVDKKIKDKTYSFKRMSIEGEFSVNILANRFDKVRKELRKLI